MNERRRPASIRPGLAPREPIPVPGERRVVFHFDQGGDVGATVAQDQLAGVQQTVAAAWGSAADGTFTINDEDGDPVVVVNLGKVRAVEFR